MLREKFEDTKGVIRGRNWKDNTVQWPKEKEQKGKQWPTKHYAGIKSIVPEVMTVPKRHEHLQIYRNRNTNIIRYTEIETRTSSDIQI